MAEIVSGLFGVDPQQLAQQRQTSDISRAFQFANLGPAEQAQYGAYLGGAQLGRAATGLLGGDAEMQKASAIKQLSSQFDLTSPTGMRAFAGALQQVAPNEAMMAAKRADEMEQAGLGRKKIAAETTLAEARTEAALREKTAPTSPLGKLIAERDLLPPNDPRRAAYDRAIAAEGEGRGTKIVMPAGETEVAKVIGKGIGEKQLAVAASGEAASENLVKINETLNELKTSNAFTGSFADLQSNIAKVQAKFAGDKKAGKKVTDTEYLDALLGSDVFPMISSLGIGARGLDTPAEREFLRKVMTGTVNLERDTLVKLTETRKAIAERAIKKYNDKVDSGELNTYFKLKGTAPTKIDLPKPPPVVRQPGQPPTGVDARVWNAMTEQEKALWK